ncbi:MAG: KilA-N domain-containing protein [Comamonadaceae bacterium]|nr:KilA-N domain-containing protein [Comamonadaceae bacterium]
MAASPAKAALPLILEDTYVRQDDQGRFSLNDLHQAAGGEDRHAPWRFSRSDGFKALVEVLTPEMVSEPVAAVSTGKPGTFVARELVYAYAMWISPAFHLKVIRTFDALVTGRLSGNSGGTMIGKATGLPVGQLVVLQDQAWKLVQRLERTQVHELRESLYQQLQDESPRLP